MYAQDYDEALPFLYVSYNQPPPRTGLAQIIQPYIMNTDVYNCPSSNQKVTWPPSYLEHCSYGYHVGLFTAGNPPAQRLLASIRRPSEIVMMGDVMQDPNARGRFNVPTNARAPLHDLMELDGSNCTVCGGSHNYQYATGHAYTYDPIGFNFFVRHNGTGNVGFMDGHAKAMTYFDMYRDGSQHPYFDYSAK